MSKHTRALVLAAVVAAMNLAGMTAVAHAQANEQPTSNQSARRPRTQAQVGEPYRYFHDALAAQGQSADVMERFRQGERASQEQPTTDNPTPPTAQVPAPVQPEQASGQPGWLVVSLAMLAAMLAVVAGLAVLAARRANHRARIGPAT